MKQLLKSLLLTVFPQSATKLLSIRSRRLNQKVWKSSGLVETEQALARSLHYTVCAGPFRGVQLPQECLREHLAPVLLGTYEQELHTHLEDMLRLPLTQIVDVGAKIGYYAVGCALHHPEVPVVAFDTDPWALRMVRQAARLNGLTNLTTMGYCSPSWLQNNIRPGALVISDCEGFETTLFDDSTLPSLARAMLVIEMHDHVVADATAMLQSRFASTHQIQCVPSVPRTLDDWPPHGPEHGVFSSDLKLALMNELRRPQNWLVMRPLAF